MPTRYTHEVMDGTLTDFRTFALRCARAFGACVMQRDEPMSNEPRELIAAKWYSDQVAAKESARKRLTAMSADERIAYGTLKREQEIKKCRQWLADAETENARLDAMVERVTAWKPPTAEHVGLRDFMLEQLRISRNETRWRKEEVRKSIERSALDYFHEDLAAALRGIDYSKDEALKEQERTDQRNAWIRALYASL